MTGRDLVLSGTRADFGQGGGADRDAAVHEPRLRASSRRSRRKRRSADRRSSTSQASRATTRTTRSTSRSCSTVSSSRRRTSTSSRTPTGSPGRTPRSTSERRLDRRGEEPRARPPDRCAAGDLQADRAHRRLCDAREGLAHPGVACRARRPRRRRALPARALPLPRPRRGDRPRDLRRSSTTPRSCSSTSR